MVRGKTPDGSYMGLFGRPTTVISNEPEKPDTKRARVHQDASREPVTEAAVDLRTTCTNAGTSKEVQQHLAEHLAEDVAHAAAKTDLDVEPEAAEDDENIPEGLEELYRQIDECSTLDELRQLPAAKCLLTIEGVQKKLICDHCSKALRTDCVMDKTLKGARRHLKTIKHFRNSRLMAQKSMEKSVGMALYMHMRLICNHCDKKFCGVGADASMALAV